MDSREQPDRWVMKYFGQDEDDQQKRPLNARRRFRATDTARDDEDGVRKDDDGNEIDFDDEFADDEEAPIMDGNEEDVKEVERKIKKEQQVAKFTNLFDEPVDEESEEQKVDKQGRNIIKSLRSLERTTTTLMTILIHMLRKKVVMTRRIWILLLGLVQVKTPTESIRRATLRTRPAPRDPKLCPVPPLAEQLLMNA